MFFPFLSPYRDTAAPLGCVRSLNPPSLAVHSPSSLVYKNKTPIRHTSLASWFRLSPFSRLYPMSKTDGPKGSMCVCVMHMCIWERSHRPITHAHKPHHTATIGILTHPFCFLFALFAAAAAATAHVSHTHTHSRVHSSIRSFVRSVKKIVPYYSNMHRPPFVIDRSND